MVNRFENTKGLYEAVKEHSDVVNVDAILGLGGGNSREEVIRTFQQYGGFIDSFLTYVNDHPEVDIEEMRVMFARLSLNTLLSLPELNLDLGLEGHGYNPFEKIIGGDKSDNVEKIIPSKNLDKRYILREE